MLKDAFQQALAYYHTDHLTVATRWKDIELNYASPGRHYHNLNHLENLLLELTPCIAQIQDWKTIVLSICYHDIMYDVLIQENEELSALRAKARLSQANIPVTIIEKCMQQITATKGHAVTGDPDTDLFTDADLSILGKNWNTYLDYSNKIRQEYNIYPDPVYKPGRRKVLDHFLQMEKIFKTGYFFNLYETNARKNMQRELEML